MDQGLEFEQVWLSTPDGEKLHTWFIPNVYNALHSSQCPTLLYFHANAGNMGFRLPFIKRLMEQAHCNVYIISYRGYGSSTGSPSEEGIMLDAQAALDHLRGRDDIDKEKIVLFGRSLGGAVAVHLAVKN